MRRAHLSAGAGVVVGAFGVSLLALAQMEPGDPRTLPYHGRLESNGVLVDGDHDLRFGLFATVDADASCLVTSTTSCGIWAEQHDDVAVSSGRFGVLLGQTGTLDDTELAYPRLFLAIAVSGPDDAGAFTLLDSKQEIHPVPWAARAAAAKNYRVTGTLEVDGPALLDSLDVEGATSLGTVELRKDLNTSRIAFAAASDDPGEIIHYDSSNTGELWVSTSDDWDAAVSNDRIVFGEFSSATVRHEFRANGNARHTGDLSADGAITAADGLTVQGYTTLDGSAEVTGDLYVDGNIQRTCTVRTTACSSDGGGNVVYLDRHNVSCSSNEFLTQWRMLRCSNENGLYFSYTCCSF